MLLSIIICLTFKVKVYCYIEIRFITSYNLGMFESHLIFLFVSLYIKLPVFNPEVLNVTYARAFIPSDYSAFSVCLLCLLMFMSIFLFSPSLLLLQHYQQPQFPAFLPLICFILLFFVFNYLCPISLVTIYIFRKFVSH